MELVLGLVWLVRKCWKVKGIKEFELGCFLFV